MTPGEGVLAPGGGSQSVRPSDRFGRQRAVGRRRQVAYPAGRRSASGRSYDMRRNSAERLSPSCTLTSGT